MWTALNKTAESATHKFKSVEPGEYTVLAKLLDDGGDPIMLSATRSSGEVAEAKNGSELRSAIASLYTATTSLNRSATLADLFDSSKIPLTYNGSTPADYSADALAAVTGLS